MTIINKYLQLDTKSRSYLVFLSFVWLIDFFGAFWRRIGVEPPVANFVIFFILFLSCYKKWRHLVRLSDFRLYIIFVALYATSAFIYPNTQEMVHDNSLEFLLVAAPFFFVGIIFKPEEYKYWLMLLSRFAVVINVLFSIALSSSRSEVDQESMHKAYVLLPSVLFILWQFLERYKLIDLFFFGLGFFLLCSMGSRGPFVCVLFFAFIYLSFFKDWNYRVTMRVILVAAATILLSLSQFIAEMMILLLSYFGKSTRIFDKMLNDSLINYEESSGRNRIQEELFKRLNTDHVGIGYGLFSDRIETRGFSAHNVLVELWFSFGYVIGSIIIGVLMTLFIRFLYKVPNNNIKIFGLIIFTVGFIKLLFSGSFIIESYFYFLIGFCISGLREVKASVRIKTIIQRGNTKEKKIKKFLID